ncbi:hypothetical protein F0310_04620, partial (plasmid) [Borrelia sp. A-FGy1]|uniref:Bdr family repetitive protein n=1 Tax=Borrelia sp. A-FGy1 TaxID=2608247 RepID=UPI00175FFE00
MSSNIASKVTSRYEYVKQVFLDKDFPEDVVDYVLLHHSNYRYENLETRMSMLEKQMIEVRDELRNGLGKLDERIVKLDEKVEKVRSELK